MFSSNSSLLILIIGFCLGVIFIYFVTRLKTAKAFKIDSETLLVKFPIIGYAEIKEPLGYSGLFIKEVSSNLEKIEMINRYIDFNVVLNYANRYDIEYIGFEGDLDGKWSEGKLAFNTLSKSPNGGYNIHLNPNLDRKVVSDKLSKQLGFEIKPDELYTFLFLHEIGHTKKSGNECYITAMVNHSLSGGRRAVRRRRALSELYKRTERYADDFAMRELIKLKKGMN
jgi:hypothetical protein